MKKLVILASALMLLGASLASAAAPGMNLGWTNCGLTSTSGNLNFACNDNTLTRNLVASYRLTDPLADFVGVAIAIEYVLGDPGTPPWFQFGSGGCREGAIGTINVGTIAGCTNSYAGANQGGGFVIDVFGPNRYRIRADWARDNPAPQTATTLYSAAVLQLSTTASFDEGFGGVCAGCEVPACFVLKYCEVYGLNTGLAQNTLGADIRNWVTYQGGGFGLGCPGETPSKNATWGAVKALYR